MPRRNDIAKILVIGSGPIVIGQSAEFDYSGTQACKALRAEGYEVVLVNSNPATIMTDPELADRTYIEPLTRDYLDEILHIESEMLKEEGRPGVFALLPTVGGQTASISPSTSPTPASSTNTASSSSAPNSKPSRRPKTASSSRMQ